MQLVTSEYLKLQGAICDLWGRTSTAPSDNRRKTSNVLTQDRNKESPNRNRDLNRETTRFKESVATDERACQFETERDWYKQEALIL